MECNIVKILVFLCLVVFARGRENKTVQETLENLDRFIRCNWDEQETYQATVYGNFEDLRDKMGNLTDSQKVMEKKVEEMDQKFNTMFMDIREKLDGLNNSQKALMEKVEDAELRDESLKKDISSLKQGCESQLESLNTTLVDFITDNENQIRKLQILLPADCQEVLYSGRRQSGVYKIFPVGMPGGVNVYCDQETEEGGWIVFLQRQQQTPQVDFVRPFEEYAKGFGEPGREFWLGNRILHAITGNSKYELRVDATSLEGETRHGSWLKFSVGSEDTQFTVTVTDYRSRSSTLGDGMSKESTGGWQSNQMKFSTYDKDHNRCSSRHGRIGWWFHACYGALPTAAVVGRSSSPSGLSWDFWEKNSSSWSYTYLSWVQMKIRAE